MSKKLKKIIPDLRFPSFDGDWTAKRLSEISNEIGDGLHGTPKYDEDGEYYFVNGNNLINNKIEFDENTKLIGESEYLKYRDALASQTILISINGTIGNLAFYNHEKIALGKSICYINLISEENKIFVFYLLQTSSIKSHFNKELTGSTIKNLSLATIRNTKPLFPSYEEQEKIASFLGAIDKRLTELRRKHKLLQTYKRGVMQKIFSQEVRFKGAIGESFPTWEKTTLGQLGVFFDAQRIPLSSEERKSKQGIYPYYGASGIIDLIDDYIFDGSYILLAEDGANIVTRSTPIAFMAEGKFWVNNHAHILKSKGSNKFLMEYLENLRYEKYNTGTAQPKLNAEVCKKIKIKAPLSEEQEKIADFLTAIDRKIEAVARQVDRTEQFKKGLLQKMFV